MRIVSCPTCGPTPVTSDTGYVTTCDLGHEVRGIAWVETGEGDAE